MNLKMKLTSAVLAFVMVLSILIVGVFSVKNATLNVGGSIVFNAKGINATISAGSLTNCGFTDDGVAGTNRLLQVKYSTSESIDNTTALASWTGIALEFTDEDGTDATITFTITNNAEAGSDEYLGITVNTTTTVTPDNATVGVSPSGEARLAPGASQVYTITFHIEDSSMDASITDFAMEFNLALAEPLLKQDETEGYYYVTMGSTINGDEIRWRYVGYVAEDGTLTASTTPVSGQQGIFYQETLVPMTSSSNYLSYQNNYTYNSSVSDKSSAERAYVNGYSDIKANDYSMSNIRAFLNGETVYRSYSESSSSNIYTHTPSGEQISLSTVFNIPADDAVYNALIGRTLANLYSNMEGGTATYDVSGHSGGSGSNSLGDFVPVDGYSINFKAVGDAVPYPSNPTVPVSSTKDKLWLMSYLEVETLVGSTSSDRTWDTNYWLRSPDSSDAVYAYGVGSSGKYFYRGLDDTYAVRAAFILGI